MQKVYRDGVPLTSPKIGAQPDALVLVHDWGYDHGRPSRQQEAFKSSHAVLNVDLRSTARVDRRSRSTPSHNSQTR